MQVHLHTNMYTAINVLAIFVLRFSQHVSGQNETPAKICSFAAVDAQIIPDKANVSDIPPQCQVVCYGFYYLDDGKDPAVTNTDIAAIDALLKGEKTVYQRVSYSGTPNWKALLDSMTDQGPGDAFKVRIKSMEEHLTKHSIAGVVLEKLGLFGDCDASKLSLFIKHLKTDLPRLRVCVVVDASKSETFRKTDVGPVNEVVDLYVIDMVPMCLTCNPDLVASGRRLSAGDLIKVKDDVSNSSMAKDKRMINFIDEVIIFDGDIGETHGITYTEFCGDFRDAEDKPIHVIGNIMACSDNIQTFVGQAKFALENVYAGIMVSYLEYDDYLNHCLCGKFPVASTILRAFDSQIVADCPRIG